MRNQLWWRVGNMSLRSSQNCSFSWGWSIRSRSVISIGWCSCLISSNWLMVRLVSRISWSGRLVRGDRVTVSGVRWPVNLVGYFRYSLWDAWEWCFNIFRNMRNGAIKWTGDTVAWGAYGWSMNFHGTWSMVVLNGVVGDWRVNSVGDVGLGRREDACLSGGYKNRGTDEDNLGNIKRDIEGRGWFIG